MPELPEVETMRRGILSIVGKRITAAERMPCPRKPILVMAGAYGGDGGTSFDIYHGRNTPSLILYADGQLLVSGGNDQYEQKYFERILSPTETCAFLDRIRRTGFLGIRGSGKNYPFDRIYAEMAAGRLVAGFTQGSSNSAWPRRAKRAQPLPKASW